MLSADDRIIKLFPPIPTSPPSSSEEEESDVEDGTPKRKRGRPPRELKTFDDGLKITPYHCFRAKNPHLGRACQPTFDALSAEDKIEYEGLAIIEREKRADVFKIARQARELANRMVKTEEKKRLKDVVIEEKRRIKEENRKTGLERFVDEQVKIYPPTSHTQPP